MALHSRRSRQGKVSEAIDLLRKVEIALHGRKYKLAWRIAVKADQKLCNALKLVARSVAPKLVVSDIVQRAIESMGLATRLAKALDRPSRLAVRKRMRALSGDLSKLKDAVGPLRYPPFVFDPASFDVIAHVAASALLAQPRHSLAEEPSHWGSGIYALYYRGKLPFYRPISGADIPIYVGSATPSVHNAVDPEAQGGTLTSRLTTHRKTIQKVEQYAPGNLKVSQFDYRILVVKSGWELAAEQYLIRYFSPVWNLIGTGMGKHGDSSTTRANRRSVWDTLHPGRKWTLTRATKRGKNSPTEIKKLIRHHFKKHPPRRLRIKDILP